METVEMKVPQYKVLALCDDVDTCEFCGRTDLQRVVAFEELETGAVLYAGTSCAETVKILVVDEETGEAKPRSAREILTRAQRASREAALAARLDALEWRFVELLDAGLARSAELYPASYGPSTHCLIARGCEADYTVNGGIDSTLTFKLCRFFRGMHSKLAKVTALARRESLVAEYEGKVEAARIEWATALGKRGGW